MVLRAMAHGVRGDVAEGARRKVIFSVGQGRDRRKGLDGTKACFDDRLVLRFALSGDGK